MNKEGIPNVNSKQQVPIQVSSQVSTQVHEPAKIIKV